MLLFLPSSGQSPFCSYSSNESCKYEFIFEYVISQLACHDYQNLFGDFDNELKDILALFSALWQLDDIVCQKNQHHDYLLKVQADLLIV